MAKNVYVGNLKFNTSDAKLKEIFSKFGKVKDVNIVRDNTTGMSKGYAFVKMFGGSKEAIEKLDRTQLGGRTIRVCEGGRPESLATKKKDSDPKS